MPEGGPSAAARGGPRRAAGRRPLEVAVADAHGRRLSASGLAAWLSRVAPAQARGAVSVALVSDARVRELNRTYLRKDRATDVLSFPAGPESWANRESRAGPESPTNPRFWASPDSRVSPESRVNPKSRIPNPFLGDIVIARGVARRQARAAGHSEAVELRILALHGLLHLLGYDHQRDEGRMQRIERRLRRKGGLRQGLIERAHA
jgi:probable rRNA maturation factor